jgi:hypothetical protein
VKNLGDAMSILEELVKKEFTDQIDDALVARLKAAHDDAMSDDKELALSGRAEKALVNGVFNFFKDEVTRNTEPSLIVNSILYQFGKYISFLTVLMVEDEFYEEAREGVFESFQEAYDCYMKEMQEGQAKLDAQNATIN